MKKHFNKEKVLAICFIVILLVPTVLFPIFKNVLRTEKGDLNENRNLKKFIPSFNNFGSAFEDYYNDHLPFRNTFIKLYQKINGNVKEQFDNATGGGNNWFGQHTIWQGRLALFN